MLAAIQKAKIANIPIGSAASEMMVLRGLAEAFEANDFGLYATRLCTNSDDELGMNILPEVVAKDLQQATVARAVVAICRTTGDAALLNGALQRLRDYLAKVSPISFPSMGLASEVVRLSKVVNISDASSVSDIDAAEALRTELLNNRSGIFFKALTILPVGVLAMTLSSVVFEQHARDKTFEADVAALEPLVVDLPKAELDLVINDGNVHVPQAGGWSDMQSRMVNIMANTSTAFKAQHHAVLARVEKRQEELQTALSLAVRKIFGATVVKLAKAMEDLVEQANATEDKVTDHDGSDLSLAVGALDLAVTGMTSIPTFGDLNLSTVLPQTSCDDICNLQESMVKFVKVATSSAAVVKAVVANEHVDIDGDAFSSILELVHDASFMAKVINDADSTHTTSVDALQRSMTSLLCGRKVIDEAALMVESCAEFVKKLCDLDSDANHVFTKELVGSSVDDITGSEEAQRVRMRSKRIFNLCRAYLPKGATNVHLDDTAVPIEVACTAMPLLMFAQVVVEVDAIETASMATMADIQGALQLISKAVKQAAIATKHISEIAEAPAADDGSIIHIIY